MDENPYYWRIKALALRLNEGVFPVRAVDQYGGSLFIEPVGSRYSLSFSLRLPIELLDERDTEALARAIERGFRKQVRNTHRVQDALQKRLETSRR